MPAIHPRRGIALALLALVAGCADRTTSPTAAPIESRPAAAAAGTAGLDAPASFDFQTVRTVALDVRLTAPDGSPRRGLPVAILDAPADSGARVLARGGTDASGRFAIAVSVASRADSVVLDVVALGIARSLVLPIVRDTVRYDNAASSATPAPSSRESGRLEVSLDTRTGEGTMNTLGTWNSQGVPNYLESTRDQISADLLARINASLPETRPVPTVHPEYLAADATLDVRLAETADVWVTFVHEGAGWLNALAFYTYPTGKPPTSLADVGPLTVVFPNVSYSGSGGGLKSGDRVNIGRFAPGTSIGFALVANGWTGGTVGKGSHTAFTATVLNPEKDVAVRQHTVLLHDDVSGRLLVGFEDMRRDSGSDNDFNDAVFFVTSNPVRAVDVAGVKPMDIVADRDGDGVSDLYDQFPDDAKRAFVSVSPAVDTYGTLAYEDLWPSVGDYDFNDLVVGYQIRRVADGQNRLVSIDATFVVRAIGAGFRNGFGWQLPFAPSAVASVQGTRRSPGSTITMASNGVERGQSKAVVIVSDDVRWTGSTTRAGFINSDPRQEAMPEDTIRVVVTLATPLLQGSLVAPPYNPFLIINGDRTREVHLADQPATDLADRRLFGSRDDDTRASSNRWYRTRRNLPWALHVGAPWAHPSEGSDVSRAYLHLGDWVTSGGQKYADWDQDLAGYRDRSKLWRR